MGQPIGILGAYPSTLTQLEEPPDPAAVPGVAGRQHELRHGRRDVDGRSSGRRGRRDDARAQSVRLAHGPPRDHQANRPAPGRHGLEQRQRLGDPQRRRRARRDPPSRSPGARLPHQRPPGHAPPDASSCGGRATTSARRPDRLGNRLLPGVRQHQRSPHAAAGAHHPPHASSSARAPATATCSTRSPSTGPATTRPSPSACGRASRCAEPDELGRAGAARALAVALGAHVGGRAALGARAGQRQHRLLGARQRDRGLG